MIALDTNILARYLLNDTPAQAERAERLLRGPLRCTAPITVFLELVWVLESSDCESAEIARSLRLLCGIENFEPQHPDALAHALHWYEGGLDFADALHLAMSAKQSEFKTFDRGFANAAKKLGPLPQVSQA